ncbi:hypothetical protein LVJ94_29825 [Pendulispora rubella]|uniref:Uncharacterized protein n=2 Tax=Pendulispora rubella TaxID=2741070 RepID=A0ABZ2KVS7_9BACT
MCKPEIVVRDEALYADAALAVASDAEGIYYLAVISGDAGKPVLVVKFVRAAGSEPVVDWARRRRWSER